MVKYFIKLGKGWQLVGRDRYFEVLQQDRKCKRR